MGGSSLLGDTGSYSFQCDTTTWNYPRARHESRSAWTDYAGNLWLFGGGAYTNGMINMNDLWMYDPTNNIWTWVEGPAVPNWTAPEYGTFQVADPDNDPGSRRGAVTWVDSWGDLWLFGGQRYNPLNDLWKYRIDRTCVNTETYIHETQDISSFSAYPNPFSGVVRVRFSLDQAGPVLVELVNVQGQIVSSESFPRMSSGEHNILLGTPELQPGRYLVLINLGETVAVRKLVKSQ